SYVADRARAGVWFVRRHFVDLTGGSGDAPPDARAGEDRLRYPAQAPRVAGETEDPGLSGDGYRALRRLAVGEVRADHGQRMGLIEFQRESVPAGNVGDEAVSRGSPLPPGSPAESRHEQVASPATDRE